MLLDFEPAARGLQYLTDDEWIPDLGIHYRLGVDGLNLWLVALTALLFAASALWLTFRPPPRASQFALHLGIAETAVLGAFLAQDLGLFVLFFDLMLVPFYFLVGMWGGPDRVAAAVKMVVYTLVGSLLMLAAAAATAVLSARGPAELSFAFSDLVANRLPGEHAEVDLRRLRARVPDQDAGLPVPRLDARRLPGDAAAGARRVLRRGLQGRRLRLPAHRAAAVPGRGPRLPDDPARARACSRSSTAR